NAIEYGVEFDDELHRVMVHGLLHLIGYDDHTPEEEKIIHEKEDYYLKLRSIV
ncbi:MAG: rRNA maturation RNase YbeY, partial [Bacteroidales bacterium]|nr:rRNA maturation RNase YbeY [Bacteroidales bacterium]